MPDFVFANVIWFFVNYDILVISPAFISILIFGALTMPIAEFETLLSGSFLYFGEINSLDLTGDGMVLFGYYYIISESRNVLYIYNDYLTL